MRNFHDAALHIYSPLCGVETVTELNRDSPFFEQPFRYIKPVSVAPTPYLQLTRRGVLFRNEAQLSDYHFKLGCSCRNWRDGTAPIRISTWAAHTFKILLQPLFPARKKWKPGTAAFPSTKRRLAHLGASFFYSAVLSFWARRSGTQRALNKKLRPEVFFVRPLLLNILTRASFFDNPSKDVRLRGGLLL